MRAGNLTFVACLVTSALFYSVLSSPLISLHSAETDAHVVEELSTTVAGHEPKRLASIDKDDLKKPKAVAIAFRERKGGGYDIGLIKMIGKAAKKGWHFPRGKWDKFADQHTHQTATRELLEEAGLNGIAEKNFVADWDKLVGEKKYTKDPVKAANPPPPKRLHGHLVLVDADQMPGESIDTGNREFRWFAMEDVGKTLGPLEMQRIWQKVYPRMQESNFMDTWEAPVDGALEGRRLDPSQPESPRRAPESDDFMEDFEDPEEDALEERGLDQPQPESPRPAPSSFHE